MRRVDNAMLPQVVHNLIENALRDSAPGTARDGTLLAVTTSPDVILLDLGLPDGDGLSLARAVRKESQAPIARAASSPPATPRGPTGRAGVSPTGSTPRVAPGEIDTLPSQGRHAPEPS